MALCGFVGSAHAVTFTENYWSAGQPNAPLYFPVAPDSYSPVFAVETGSSDGNYRSPYQLNTDSNGGAFYDVLAPGSSGQTGSASATYNLNSATVFALLWGSPDTYNQVQFWSGAGGTGTLLDATTYTGASLQCYGNSSCTQYAWDVVTFTAGAGQSFGSVVLTDVGNNGGANGTPAFEYGLRVGSNQSEAPLPAAFWLFGTVIAGAAGASRMRRRRQVQPA